MGDVAAEDAMAMLRFLNEGGYETITEWALDSDYTFFEDEWWSEEGHRVDIVQCLYDAMDASEKAEA